MPKIKKTDILIIINLLLIILALYLIDHSDLDLKIQNHFFNFKSKSWLIDKNEPVKKFLFYQFPKILLAAAIIFCLAAFTIGFTKHHFLKQAKNQNFLSKEDYFQCRKALFWSGLNFFWARSFFKKNAIPKNSSRKNSSRKNFFSQAFSKPNPIKPNPIRPNPIRQDFFWKNRWFFLLVFLGLGLIPLIAGNIKKFTNIYCPAQLEIYGDQYPYVKIFDSYPKTFNQLKKGQCFPAGHPLAGFAFFILFFALKKKSQRFLSLASTLIWGILLGFYQMAKGAHFFGDIIVAMLVSFLLAAIISSIYQKRRFFLKRFQTGSNTNSI